METVELSAAGRYRREGRTNSLKACGLNGCMTHLLAHRDKRGTSFEAVCGELQGYVSARVRDTMRALSATYGVSEAVRAVLS